MQVLVVVMVIAVARVMTNACAGGASGGALDLRVNGNAIEQALQQVQPG